MTLFVLNYSHAIVFAERSKPYDVKHLSVGELQDVTLPTCLQLKTMRKFSLTNEINALAWVKSQSSQKRSVFPRVGPCPVYIYPCSQQPLFLTLWTSSLRAAVPCYPHHHHHEEHHCICPPCSGSHYVGCLSTWWVRVPFQILMFLCYLQQSPPSGVRAH